LLNWYVNDTFYVWYFIFYHRFNAIV
jgi:hypothetical protein